MAQAEKLDNGRKQWTVMIYMIADDPAGGELLDQQANQELDEIVFAALGPTRESVNVAVQVDFRSQPDVWRRLIGKGAWLQPESPAADPATLRILRLGHKELPRVSLPTHVLGSQPGAVWPFYRSSVQQPDGGSLRSRRCTEVRRPNADTQGASRCPWERP